MNPPRVEIPLALRLRGRNPNEGKGGDADLSITPVDPEVCELVAENFITVTPSLNMGKEHNLIPLRRPEANGPPALARSRKRPDHGYGWKHSVLSALLDHIVRAYRVDAARIHVTGFSMGGYGTWELGISSPERFATLMPICGGGDTVLAKNIKHVPQWVHHGERDDIIPVSASKKMVDALLRAGAEEVRFTRHPDAAHDSWTAAYGNTEVWRWMLGHRNRGAGEEVVAPDANKVDVAQAVGDLASERCGYYNTPRLIHEGLPAAL